MKCAVTKKLSGSVFVSLFIELNTASLKKLGFD